MLDNKTCCKIYYARNRKAVRLKQNELAATPERKAAQKERAARHYQANAEAYKERARKRFVEKRDEILRQKRDYQKRNAAKIAKKKRETYVAHREAILAQQRSYRAENLARDKEKQRRNYERHREARIAAVRVYEVSLSPEEKSAINYRRNKNRRARVKGALGQYTRTDYDQILCAQNFRCYWCFENIAGGGDHADHHIPLARGGSNWPENIVGSCASCNRAKGAKLPVEFVHIVERVLV